MAAAQTATTATLAGRVVDQTGAPIAQAAVVWWAAPAALQNDVPMALRMSPPQPITVRGAALSDANGQFQVPNLQAGGYSVCITSLAQQSHLSTCEWRSKGVTLTASDPAQPLDLVVQVGCVLRFHVSDAKARLTSKNLTVVVSNDKGEFAHARVVSITPTDAQLAVSVPFSSRIAIIVDAPFPLHDGAGIAVPLRVPSLTVTISTEVEHDFLFTAE